MAKSYKFFLAGDDYQSQAVDDEISQEAENRAEQIKARNHQLQQVMSLVLNVLAGMSLDLNKVVWTWHLSMRKLLRKRFPCNS